jgi:parallel beta-helix repeat protein
MSIRKFFLLLLFCVLPSLAFAGKSYYVDCNANFNGDGSFAKPWNDIKSVNNKVFAKGDDVYFKVDTTCTANAELRVDWTGTRDDRVIIGAYYDNGMFGLSSHNRPTIDGKNWMDHKTTKGQIEIFGDSYDYITVKDLSITFSPKYGIRARWSDNINIENCYVHRTASSGIFMANVKNCHIDRNTVEETSTNENSGAGILLSGMGVRGGTTACNISNNIVFHNYEGIGAYKGADHSIIEFNEVYDNRGYQVYLENAAYMTVRYNLIYGSSDWKKWRPNSRAPGTAIAYESEQGRCDTAPDAFPYIGNTRIYGNLIAWTDSGIALGDQCAGSAQVGNKILQNTIVGCVNSFRFGDNLGWSNNEIKNNISLTLTPIEGKPTSRHVYKNNYSRDGVEWSHNNFSDSVSGNAANNAVIGNPLLRKTSGWRTITPRSVTGLEWRPQEKSPVKNMGLPLNENVGQIHSIDPDTNKIRVKITTEINPDIGAWSFSPNPNSVSSPRNLKIVVKSD